MVCGRCTASLTVLWCVRAPGAEDPTGLLYGTIQLSVDCGLWSQPTRKQVVILQVEGVNTANGGIMQ